MRYLTGRCGSWSPMLSSRPLLAFASVACLLLAALGLAPLLAIAAPGGSPAEAIVIGGDGRFSGTVGPQAAQWFRFSYRGVTPLAIVVAYEPSTATGIDFELYTGDASNPRSEGISTARRDNTLSASWSDASARDVLLQVVNTRPVGSAGFIGSIQPTGALFSTAATPTASPTASAESGTNSSTAITLGTDGTFSGVLAPRQ